MSEQPVRLAPMICLRCQTPLNAQVDETAWACPVCGQGLLLDPVQDALKALDIHYAAGLVPGRPGRPFWVASGRVTIQQRQTYRGNRSEESAATWALEHTFIIPAYELPLQQVVELGTQFLLQPPSLQAGSPAAFTPVTVPPGDIRPLAEFIVLGLEAGRKDALRLLNFDLTLGEPQLWVLP